MTNKARKNSKLLHYSAAAVVLAGLAGCEGCGAGSDTKSLTSLVAADAQAAVVVVDLPASLEQMRAYLTKATVKLGPMSDNVQKAAKQQAGFDLFSAASYEAVGVAPEPGLVVFTEGASPEPILAFAVTDAKKADDWVAKLAKRLNGASEVGSETRDGFLISNAGRPFGTEVVPVMHWTAVGKAMLVSRSSGLESLLAAAKRIKASKPDAKTLEDDPVYGGLVRKVPKATVRLFARGSAASALTGGADAELSSGAMVGINFSEHGVHVDTFVNLAVPGMAEALDGEAPLDLAKRIEGDAVVAVMSRAASPAAVAALKKHPTVGAILEQAMKPLKATTGINPEEAIVPNLGGDLTASVHLQDVSELMTVLRSRPKGLNPFLNVIHAVVTLDVKDAKKMEAALDASKGALETDSLKFKKTTSERNGKALIRYEPDRETAKLAWALYGTTYIYGAGPGRLDRALDALDGKHSTLDLAGSPAEQLAKEEGATVVAIRVGEIGKRAGDLAATVMSPAAAGLGGGIMSQLVTSVVETSKVLGDLALSLKGEPEGLRLTMRQNLP